MAVVLGTAPIDQFACLTDDQPRCPEARRAMQIFDKVAAFPDLLRELGDRARAKAKQAGVPSYYEDPQFGTGIVEEMPDGTRRLIEHTENQDMSDLRPGLR